MADLFARIRMDDKEFNEKIRKNKKELETLKNIGGNVSSALKNLGMQFAAAAGLMETFTTAINSNKATQDDFNEICIAAKESVEDFFTALESGDWSVFENGILNAISQSKKYAKAMRELKSSLKFGDIKLSKGEKDLNKFENIAANESLSDNERENAFKQFKKEGEKTLQYIKNLRKYTEEEFSKMLSAKNIKVNREEASDIIFEFLDPSTAANKALKKYDEIYKKYSSAISSSMIVPSSPVMGQVEDTDAAIDKKNEKDDSKELERQLKAMQKIFPQIEAARKIKLSFGTEEELDNIIELNDRLIGLEDRAESATKQITDLSKSFDKNDKLIKKDEKVKVKAEVEYDQTSIAYLDKQLSQKKMDIELATDDISRQKLYKEIQDLTEKKRVIEFKYKFPTAPQAPTEPSNKGNLLSLASTPAIPPMPTLKGVKNDDSSTLKDSTDNANMYADALSNCASAVATFNASKLEDTGEGWTQWSSNLLAAAASTILGLQSLTMAKGVNSAFDLPFPANVAAAAMVLSTVISLFASIPAFAEGGIVSSAFTTGDKNLVRVNGGEMILTRGQQANLFRMLDNSIAATSANITFRLKGSDIYGSLNNYNKKLSKI